jgi:hypothetical protein
MVFGSRKKGKKYRISFLKPSLSKELTPLGITVPLNNHKIKNY